MSGLPAVLEDAWNSAQPVIQNVRNSLISGSSLGTARITRVGQLDSELLDQELTNLLQEPITKALVLLNSRFKSSLQPELTLFIQLTLYKLSIWNTGASYGAKLQDLRYVVTGSSTGHSTPSGLPRKTLLLHATLTFLMPYFHNKLRNHALSHAWPEAPSSDSRKKAWDILNSVESTYSLLGLVNFVAFLWGGRYRTLADRLLSMHLTPSRRSVKRDVSYEFMNRQMVWHAFTEFLLFLLPLISARAVRRRFYKITTKLSPSLLLSLSPFKGILQPSSGWRKEERPPQKRGKYWALPDDQCAICAENTAFNLNVSDSTNAFTLLASDPTLNSPEDAPAHPIHNPYQTTCGHIYCYQCIAERMLRVADEADDEEHGWECLRCSERVKESRRYQVEITESEGDISESEYDFSSDLDLSTDLSGSMGSYSESGFSD